MGGAVSVGEAGLGVDWKGGGMKALGSKVRMRLKRRLLIGHGCNG